MRLTAGETSPMAASAQAEASPRTRLNNWALWWRTNQETAKEAEARVLALADDDTCTRTQKNVPVDDKGNYMNTIEVTAPNSRVPLVLAHGYGAGVGFWFKNLAPLARAGFHVYAFDWIGMGNSSRPNFNCSSPEETEAFFLEPFEAWCKELNLTNFVLVGHSLGGYLSGVYALQHPERVRHLVLASPVGVPAERSRPPPKGALFSVAKKLWSWDVTPQGIVRAAGPWGASAVEWFTNRRFSDDHLPGEHRPTLQEYIYSYMKLPGSGECVAFSLRFADLCRYALNALMKPIAMARNPLCHRLPELTVPSTFLYGSHDWMEITAAQQLQPSMSTPTSVHEISKAGHHVYLDNADEFHGRILDACRAMLQAS